MLGSGVKGQGSDLQHVRQGCVQHNQVREKGAKVRDRAWGQFLWPQNSSHSQPSLTPSRSTPFREDSAHPPHPKPPHSLGAGFLGGGPPLGGPRWPPPGGREELSSPGVSLTLFLRKHASRPTTYTCLPSAATRGKPNKGSEPISNKGQALASSRAGLNPGEKACPGLNGTGLLSIP